MCGRKNNNIENYFASLCVSTRECVCTLFCLACRDCSNIPRPKSFTPALLLTTVKPFGSEPFRAEMRFSGIPQRPNPPTSKVQPLGISFTASSARSKNTALRWLVTEKGRYTWPATEVQHCSFILCAYIQKITLTKYNVNDHWVT